MENRKVSPEVSPAAGASHELKTLTEQAFLNIAALTQALDEHLANLNSSAEFHEHTKILALEIAKYAQHLSNENMDLAKSLLKHAKTHPLFTHKDPNFRVQLTIYSMFSYNNEIHRNHAEKLLADTLELIKAHQALQNFNKP